MPHSPRTLPQLNLIASQLVWLYLERRQLGRILSHGLFPRFPKPGGRGWKLLIFLFPILQMQRCLSCVPLRRLNPQALFTTAASAQPLTSPWNISSTITTVPQFSSDSFQINEEKAHLPYTMDGHVPFNNSYAIVMSATTHRRSFHQLSWKKRFGCGKIPLSIESKRDSFTPPSTNYKSVCHSRKHCTNPTVPTKQPQNICIFVVLKKLVWHTQLSLPHWTSFLSVNIASCCFADQNSQLPQIRQLLPGNGR